MYANCKLLLIMKRTSVSWMSFFQFQQFPAWKTKHMQIQKIHCKSIILIATGLHAHSLQCYTHFLLEKEHACQFNEQTILKTENQLMTKKPIYLQVHWQSHFRLSQRNICCQVNLVSNIENEPRFQITVWSQLKHQLEFDHSVYVTVTCTKKLSRFQFEAC